MGNVTRFFIGTHLAVLSVVAMPRITDNANHGQQNRSATIPLFYRSHAAELVEGGNTLAAVTKPSEYAYYIHQKTRENLAPIYLAQSDTVAEALIQAANDQHLDPLFLMAVIMRESRFNPRALGSHGEIGLMQLKPETARWILMRENPGTEITVAEMRRALFDPATNIRLGAAYFNYLRVSFHGQRRHYIAAYNMGLTNVRVRMRAGADLNMYSAQVLAFYRDLASPLNPKAIRYSLGARSIASSPNNWTFDLL